MTCWQKKLIQDNLSSLIEVTRCTEGLKARLLSRGLLSKEEVETLTAEERNNGETRAASKLYSIMETRTNGIFSLIVVLQQTQQTDAWNIFQSAIKAQLSAFPVKLSGDMLKLNELFTSWTNENSMECLDSADTMKEFCELLSRDDTFLDLDKALLKANPHPLYIPRSVSNRVLLDVAVFKENCQDVFVFTGMKKIQVVELLDPLPVRSSSEQLTLITCKHIYLEKDEDWDDLKDVAKTSLHLITKEKGQFVLQRSTQITTTILNHSNGLQRRKASYISEEKLAEEILTKRNSKGICVCDIPGMGKTWLLESIASKLQKLSHRTLVLFVQLSQLANSLSEISKFPMDPSNYIFETLTSSKLVCFILQRHLKKSGLEVIFVLDGFDEVHESYVDITTKFLKQLIAKENVRLVISSRPHMRKHLEDTFQVISYDLLPFGREEQVSAIVGQWQLSITNCESKLRAYAEQCIRVVKDIECEDSKNILGIPLKCYILAEVNLKYAQQLARRKEGLKVAEEAVINSISDLYEKFVESRISETSQYPDSGNMRKRILSFLIHAAMSLLFPEITSHLSLYFYAKIFPLNTTQVVKLGILSVDSNSQLVFFHRSLAEYFAGKFFAEFWKKLGDFDDELICLVGYYFLDTMLNSEQNRKAQKNFKVFFNDNPYKTKIRWFDNRTVLWFMNSLHHEDTTIHARFKETLLLETTPNETNYNFTDFKIMLKKKGFEILITCIEEKFRALLSLFLQILQVFFEPCELFEIINNQEHGAPLLLIRTALSGFPETAHKILQIFSQSEENNLLNYCDEFPLKYYSPLEVSIDKNDVDMFDYLHKKVKVPRERLLLRCLFRENFSPIDISKKAEIFRRILAENKNESWTVNTQDFKQYLESLSITEELDVTKWIDFSFHHNLSLCELPRLNKYAILKSSLAEVSDVRLFELLQLLFGQERTLRHELSRNMISSSTNI